MAVGEQHPELSLVGTARCAVRAAYQRRNVWRNSRFTATRSARSARAGTSQRDVPTFRQINAELIRLGDRQRRNW
jgi:hypothetical protein